MKTEISRMKIGFFKVFVRSEIGRLDIKIEKKTFLTVIFLYEVPENEESLESNFVSVFR